MTQTIARATNDKGQVVELQQQSGDHFELYRVTHNGFVLCNWSNEQNAYAQFANACAVESKDHE